MTAGYIISLVFAIGLLIAYLVMVKNKEFWLTMLYICVSVVNLGYTLLSSAKTVNFAIFGNDVAYLGSVFLSMCMFLTIVRLCGFDIKKTHVTVCLSLGAVMYLIVATSGFLPWYYKSVELEIIDGSAKLIKEYGPLHNAYLVYLLGYFAVMIGTIIYSVKKKKCADTKFAGFIAGIVCSNIVVWLFEKFIDWEFEFLSVTYIASELMLLLVYWMMQDYVHKNELSKLASQEKMRLGIDIATMPMDIKIGKVLFFVKNGETLAMREREILELILENKRRKEIAEHLCLSENTVKTYTRTLYSKLGVTSREELYALLLQENQ
jgi:DNA-binding CsgD family transcriptional regulator